MTVTQMGQVDMAPKSSGSSVQVLHGPVPSPCPELDFRQPLFIFVGDSSVLFQRRSKRHVYAVLLVILRRHYIFLLIKGEHSRDRRGKLTSRPAEDLVSR